MALRRSSAFIAELGGIPLESSATTTNATATPAAIVAVTTHPAVTASSGVSATASPAAIVTATTHPAVTVTKHPVAWEPFHDFTTNSWVLTGPTPTLVTGRNPGQSPNFAANLTSTLAGSSGQLTYTIPSASESDWLVLGTAWKSTSVADVMVAEFMSDSGATSHTQLWVGASGDLQIRSSGSIRGASSTGLIAINTWYYLEVRVHLGDGTAGSWEVRRNGVTAITLASGDTKNAGTKTVYDTLRLQPTNNLTSTVNYDDLYLDSGAAATFLGDPSGVATASPAAIFTVTTHPAVSAHGPIIPATVTPAAIVTATTHPPVIASGPGTTKTVAAITVVAFLPAPTAKRSTRIILGTGIFVRTGMPSPFVTGTRPVGVFAPIGKVRLYDKTGNTLVANLQAAFDIEWQDVDNGPGIGRFSIPLSEPDSALIKLGQIVYCDLYDRLGVYAWIVEEYPQSRIQHDEELGQVMKVSGRGRAAILDTALCYPYGGVNAVPVRSVRSFSFASGDYIEGAGWVPATEIAEQGDMTTLWTLFLPETTYLSSAPGAWPFLPIIPSWIWAQADNTVNGICYFRETFHTDAPADVEIIATGDNYWTMYLDGVAILGDNENLSGWEEHRSESMLLPAGDHTVAAVVNNVFVLGLPAPLNPGGFLMAIVIPHEQKDSTPDLMLLSDGGWNALAYPAQEPGWTPGQIIIKLIQEAAGRSLLADVAVDFSLTNDSSGAAWEQIPELGVNVGSSLLSTLDQLTKDGWIEWTMTPNQVLRMWKSGNRGTSTSVVLAAGVNVGETNFEPAHTIVNRLLVAYGKGMFVVDDVASQATWGIHEGYLTLDTSDIVEATRLADASIAEAADAELAVTMGIEPRGASPDRPYVNFQVGDSLTGPSETGTSRTYQVLGVTVQIDLMGDPVLSLELNRRVTNPEETRVSLLQTLGSAVVGTAPGSRSVVFQNDGPYFRTRTSTRGAAVAAGEPSPGEVVFTVPGTVDSIGTSPRWVTPYRFLIYQVVMAVATAGSGDIVVRVLGKDFTLPAGRTEIQINSTLHRDSANSFTIALTDVGSGDAVGLTVTLRYRYYTGPDT